MVFGVPALDRLPFLELKSIFSAIEGAIVTPFIVLATLSELSAQRAQAGP
jgi:hypothetical protein